MRTENPPREERERAEWLEQKILPYIRPALLGVWFIFPLASLLSFFFFVRTTDAVSIVFLLIAIVIFLLAILLFAVTVWPFCFVEEMLKDKIKEIRRPYDLDSYSFTFKPLFQGKPVPISITFQWPPFQNTGHTQERIRTIALAALAQDFAIRTEPPLDDEVDHIIFPAISDESDELGLKVCRYYIMPRQQSDQITDDHDVPISE